MLALVLEAIKDAPLLPQTCSGAACVERDVPVVLLSTGASSARPDHGRRALPAPSR